MTLRVVFVNHSTEPGGAELALVRLLEAGFDQWSATVVTPRGSAGAFARLAEVPNIKHLFLGPPLRPGASSAGLRGQVRNLLDVGRQLTALALSEDVRRSDVLYANSARAAVYTTIGGRLLGRPVVVHLRDSVDRAALGPVGYFAVSKVVLPLASGVIANSQFTLSTALAAHPRIKVSTVISSPVQEASDRPTAPLRREVRVVGMLARLAPWKGQHLVIEAFARAFPTENCQLLLAGAPLFGEADYLGELRLLAEQLGIAERVQFLGHVDDAMSFIDGLDIAVQYSTRPEPLGQNVLQYLARGRPTIAADEGGPAESIKSGASGVLVQARDVAALAEALRRLALDHDARRLLGAAAESSPVTMTNDVVAQTADFLRHVRASRRSRRWPR
ncbi:glycosyltransferase family 4 protein [Georgenia muralis]